MNGQPVKSNSELRNTIGLLRVGDKVDIGLVRDGKPVKVTAIIADTATEPGGAPASIHKAWKARSWPTRRRQAARWCAASSPAAPRRRRACARTT